MKVPENEDELFEVEGDESVIIGQDKLPRTTSMKWLEKACTPVPGEPLPEFFLPENNLPPVEESAQGEEGAAPMAPSTATSTKTKAPKASKKSVLVTLTEVEEFKCLIRLLPTALSLIMYNAIYAQMSTMFVLQGEGMNTQLGSINVPAATVSVLDCISVIVFVFVYDLAIAPFFERMKHPITPLVRIGAGYIVAMCSMLVAGGLEVARLNVVQENNMTDITPGTKGAPVVPISVWWQIPQYALIGLSEVLAMAGSLAMFYQEAPDALRSTFSAIQLLATGLGSYVSSALLAIIQAITATNGSPGWIAANINEGHLDYWFFTLAVLMLLNILVFVWIAKRYRYREHAVHRTVDPEALALAADGRCGLAYSRGMIKSMSKDLSAGMVTLQSARSTTSAGGLSASYSQYRTSAVARISIRNSNANSV